MVQFFRLISLAVLLSVGIGSVGNAQWFSKNDWEFFDIYKTDLPYELSGSKTIYLEDVTNAYNDEDNYMCSASRKTCKRFYYEQKVERYIKNGGNCYNGWYLDTKKEKCVKRKGWF